MKAKFEIQNCFKITGRGLVLAGIIKEGEINIGDKITFNERTATIKGVEEFRTLMSSTSKVLSPKVGLLVDITDEAEIAKIKEWNPNGIVVDIHD